MARFRHQFAALSRRLPLCALLFLLPGAGALDAAPLESPPAASTNVSHVLLLEYQRAPNSLVYGNQSRVLERVTFQKEPALGARGVYRARLRLEEGTNGTVALAWDRAAGKLYVDLNANLDLTDDPAGVFTAASSGRSQSFTNIALTVSTAAGPHPRDLELNFYSYASGDSADPMVQVSLHSFWQCRLDWQGRAWQVGVVEQIGTGSHLSQPAMLVLRPWENRDKPLNIGLDAVPFATSLFWQGRAFQVRCALTNGGGAHRFRLELTERHLPLGQLNITGRFVHRIVLSEKSGARVVLDGPEGIVKVPQGEYNETKVWLGRASGDASLDLRRPLVVGAQGPASLFAGGPLTNTVSAQRRGRHLVLTYRAVGAGETDYEVARRDTSDPPRFAIYHDGKQVASGKFEFG